jgi:hypothetical protein
LAGFPERPFLGDSAGLPQFGYSLGPERTLTTARDKSILGYGEASENRLSRLRDIGWRHWDPSGLATSMVDGKTAPLLTNTTAIC